MRPFLPAINPRIRFVGPTLQLPRLKAKAVLGPPSGTCQRRRYISRVVVVLHFYTLIMIARKKFSISVNVLQHGPIVATACLDEIMLRKPSLRTLLED